MNATSAALILSFASFAPGSLPHALGASPIPTGHRTADRPFPPGEQPAVRAQSSASRQRGQYRKPGPSLPSPFLPNQVIVKLNPGRTLADIRHLIAKYNVAPVRRLTPKPHLLGGQPDGNGGKLRRQGVVDPQLLLKLQRRSLRAPARLESLHMHNIYVLGVPAEAHLFPLLHDCQINPAVRYAELDYLPKSSTLPDDTYIDPDQNGDWSYGSWGQDYNDLWGLEAVQSHMAWDISQGAEEIIIAVVDTGVDYSHEDITANIWTNELELKGVDGVDDDLNGYVDDVRGWDFSALNSDVTDTNGHGTHVAGIAAAIGNNARGIAGVTWHSKVMCLKASSSSAQAEAIRYAADNGADIINMSWRYPNRPWAVDDAIRYAYYGDGPYSGGVILVAAAGNDEADAADYFPGELKETITISAANHVGLLADFSNFGSAIDVAAPGTDILSLLAAGTTRGTPVDEHYTLLSGTSQAAPYVAGLSALVLSHYPAFGSEEVRQVLRTTGDDLGEAGWDTSFGHGQINAFRALQVDHEPCLALITNPQQKATVDGVVSAEGLAYGVHFASYELWVKALGGGSWQQIGDTAESPVAYGELLAWDTTPFVDGSYLLKLIVTDTFDDVYTDYCSVAIDRTYVTSPEPEDVLRIGGIIDIVGTVEWPSFSSYYLEYEFEQSPGLWYTNGVQLTNGGLQEVQDQTIAQLDTAQMPIQEAGRCRIRIVVNGSEAEVVPVYLDPTLKEGWPQKLPVGYGAYFMMQLAAADLTGGDAQEIVVNYPVYSKGAFAFSGDSSYLDAWPVAPDGSIYFGAPAIGDVDGDGSQEVVFAVTFTGGVFLYVFRGDGTVQNSWPLAGSTVMMNSVVVADINLDSKAEIIALSRSSTTPTVFLEVFDNAGDYLDGDWPRSIQYSYGQSCFYNGLPAVGNLDGDREFEIVYANGLYISGEEVPWKTELLVLNGDGTMVEGWPRVYEYNSRIASPVVGDLDGDGAAEIVLLTDRYVYALDSLGDVLWAALRSHSGGSPALADFEGDGYLEVVYNAPNHRRTIIVDYQGDVVRDLMHGGVVEYYNNSFPLGSSAIGDVDGDDVPDIVVQVKDKVIAWNVAGAVLDGFPKQIAKSEFGTPLLGDIDGDGVVDLVACANDYADGQRAVIYAWNIGGSYDQEDVDWPQFHYDCGRSGCYGCFACPSGARWGDADCDGDVDLEDFAVLSDCLSGPGCWPDPAPPTTPQGCVDAFDVDGDSDVDLADFLVFQAAFEGT